MNSNEKIKSPEDSIKINGLSFQKRLELQTKVLEIIKTTNPIQFQELNQSLDNFIEELESIEESSDIEEIKIENEKNMNISMQRDIQNLKDMFMDGNIKTLELKNICKKIKNKLKLMSYEKRI